MRRLLSATIIISFGLVACSIRDDSDGNGDQNGSHANDTPMNISFSNEPFSEKSFRTDLIQLYQNDKYLYDNAINDVAKSQIRDKWERDFCSFLSKRIDFHGWKGRLDQISQPNIVVIFNINIGNGIKLVNSPFNDLDLKSPAYKVISQTPQGSEVTVSGKFAPSLLGDCNTPSMPLNGDVSDIQFKVVLTSFNGAST